MAADLRSRDMDDFRAKMGRSWVELTRLVLDSPDTARIAEARLRQGQADPMAFVASLQPPEAALFARLAYLAIGEGMLRALEFTGTWEECKAWLLADGEDT